MLTNLYYYDYYRPYILKNENNKLLKRKDFVKSNYKNLSSSNNSEKNLNSFSFFLNKSLKNEVINYASTVSREFNSIKDTARFMQNNLNDNSFEKKENANNIFYGMNDFVNQYNSYLEFADDNDQNSNILRSYADEIVDIVSKNKDELESIGIKMDDGGRLSIDEEIFGNIDAVKNVSDNIKNMYSDIYKNTCQAMNAPLSQHMNFKNLSYYYNYKYASIDYNSFDVMDTGMLVDIKL